MRYGSTLRWCGLRFGLRIQSRVDFATVELADTEVAIVAQARVEGVARGWIVEIQWIGWVHGLRHDSLLDHNARAAGDGWLGIKRVGFQGRLHSGKLDKERLRATQSDDLVENAVGKLALGHIG